MTNQTKTAGLATALIRLAIKGGLKVLDSDLKNLATKSLIGGIIGGNVGALGTGEQLGETREQKRKRLLRNTLLGVAGGAGLGALSQVKISNQTKTAFAEKDTQAIISSILRSTTDTLDSDLKNLAIKSLIGGILGGGVGALGTGEQPGETREQKRKRLLRNSLLGVAGGAGLGALSQVQISNQTKTAFAEKFKSVASDLQNKVKETAFAEKFKSVASDLQNKVKDIDLSNPTLLAGLGSAGAAALLTGLQKRKKKESLGKKTLNVLGNASIAGALGAGATSLLRSGTKNLEEALPASDVDPTTNLLKNPLTAVLSGGIGTGIGAKFTKNMQPARAIQDLKNYASALSSSSSLEESKLGKELYEALDAGDIAKARAKLVTLFGDPISFVKNFNRGTSPFQTVKDLKKFLRYQNINTEAPLTFKSFRDSMRGALERGIDLRGVKGIGGRGARVGTGVIGALAGIGLPYAVSGLNEYLQNK